MDDDPVLRTLAADLEREDPRLAEFLSGRRASLPLAHRHHPALWIAAVLAAMLVLAVTLPITVAVGVLAMVVVVGCPIAVCWLISITEEPPRPRTP
jgi:hypothetical protein